MENVWHSVWSVLSGYRRFVKIASQKSGFNSGVFFQGEIHSPSPIPPSGALRSIEVQFDNLGDNDKKYQPMTGGERPFTVAT